MPRPTRCAGGEHIYGDGPSPPKYVTPLSVQSSCKYHREYEEYERNIKLSNSGQTVQRPLVLMQQLLPKSVRKSLAFTLFKRARGLELAEDDLKEGIARHGECWNGAEADPREIKAKVEHLLVMGSEPTALDRIDAVTWRLEDYFENPSAEKVFRDADGKYVKGPARVLTAALVAGLKPHEFKVEVESALQMKGNWKEDPVAVFGAVRAAALDWRVVERADKRRSQAHGKSAPQKKQRPQRGKNDCWTCGEVGYRSYGCPARGASGAGGGSGSGSSTSRGSLGARGEPSGRRKGGIPAATGRYPGSTRWFATAALDTRCACWR